MFLVAIVPESNALEKLTAVLESGSTKSETPESE
jgi:hypothetical protein